MNPINESDKDTNIIPINALANQMTNDIKTPISNEVVISQSDDLRGNIGAISILFTDSNNKKFAIYFSTLKNYIETIHDNDSADESENNNDAEPVFVIPTETLNVDTVMEFLHNINGKLLKYYAVIQNDDISA